MHSGRGGSNRVEIDYWIKIHIEGLFELKLWGVEVFKKLLGGLVLIIRTDPLSCHIELNDEEARQIINKLQDKLKEDTAPDFRLH